MNILLLVAVLMVSSCIFWDTDLLLQRINCGYVWRGAKGHVFGLVTCAVVPFMFHMCVALMTGDRALF
jgi:hypothetical protein